MADYDTNNLEHDTVTLMLDNDEEVVCDVIAVFPSGEYEYIALMQRDNEDAPVWLYRFTENPDDEEDITLDSIESDEEFEEVSAAFDAFMEDEEMEEALEEE